MDKRNAIVDLIRSEYDESAYPEAFIAKYDRLECLGDSHGVETFLVQAKGSNTHYLAKCYDKAVCSIVNESVILKQLHHASLPRYEEAFENDALVVVVREYIEGLPLDRYAAEKDLTYEQIIHICVKVCDILLYLHMQQPPVIHRDIKPQNIIVKPDGNIVLIDFDIARVFHDEADTDTQFFGTRVYAPPEQYGFTQTDCRADIYSVGILLRYLLTGDAREQPSKPVPQQFRRIVERCTAFSPKDRYASAAAVKAALMRSAGTGKKKLLLSISFLLTAILFLCTGFVVGRYTTALAPKPAYQSVSFSEPLIEAAARAQLGKADGEFITADELNTVKALYIFGNKVSATQDAFEDGLGESERYERGGITTLADLALMPNLTKIEIAYQALTDIKGIEALQYLEAINLRHNQITDVTLLAGLANLKEVCLFDTNVSDVSCLASCKRLFFLDVGHTLVTSMDALCGYDTVTMLSLKMLKLDTLDGIERFIHLETLYLNGAVIEMADAITKLPRLKSIYASEATFDLITRLLEGAGVTIISE